MLVIDPDTGNIIDANKAAADFYGWSIEELEQMRIQQINTLSPEAVKDEMEKARSSKGLVFEFRHRRADGSIRDVEVFSNKIEVKGKDVLYSLVHDITERKRLESMLHDSQALMTAIVESTSEMIWSVDSENFGLLTFNHGLSDYFFKLGISLQTGMRPEDMVPTEEFTRRWHGLYQRALSEGAYATEYIGIAGAAEMLLRFGILSRDGRVFGISVFGKDITERKRSDLELVSAQQRVKEAHRLAHIGTWDWVMEDDTGTWSDELYNIAGRDPSLPAPTYAEHSRVYAPASWDLLSSAVTRALTTGEPYSLELELVRPDGSTRWTNAFGGVKHDGNGKIIGLHGTLQDITERKRAEESLRKQDERYKRVIENIFKFIPEGILVFTDKLRLFNRNKTFDDIVRMYSAKLGYTEQELTELIFGEVKNKLAGEAGATIRIPKKKNEEREHRTDHSIKDP
jgi:PAS domain S-box-containing protein